MSNKKNVSSLSDHKLYKKKGVVITPLNDALRDQLKLSLWTKERMPEYLWLGFILLYLGRKVGLEKAGRILFEISKNFTSLSYPRFSMILSLSDEEQKIIYGIISKHVEKKVLAPLTILYKNKDYPIFNDFFYIPEFNVEDRISVISKAIKIYSPHQANEATDLRFLALSLLLFGGRLHISKDIESIAKAFQEYPCTDHDDKQMRMYRPTIRSLEGINFEEKNNQFIKNFWREIGMITPCNPKVIQFDENTKDYNDFIRYCKKILEYVLSTNKEKSLTEDKFDVIIGSTNYILKIFIEINEKSLGNNILGRHGIRTIIEIYIMLKYLLKKESENPNIWEEYKLYGISKYKLILLKARENDVYKTSHFIPPIADILVNEIKWEEFIDIDLKYFDKQGIRDKSIAVGEKKLYDRFYDYDSNFSHGLWGAIRESSMLHCDNANHQYHSIPDIHSNQLLPDVKSDCVIIIKKIYELITEIYNVPETLSDYLGDKI
jgi:hypothetical protein